MGLSHLKKKDGLITVYKIQLSCVQAVVFRLWRYVELFWQSLNILGTL